MIIFVGIVIVVVSILTFLYGLETYTNGAVVFGITGILGGLIMVGVGVVHVANRNQQQETTVTYTDNQAASNKQQAPPPDSKWPRDYPEDAPKAVKDKWYRDWAKDVLDNTPIVCRDGVQVEVVGGADLRGGTSWASAYVRVHPDGKPFTCSESTDPTKEESK